MTHRLFPGLALLLAGLLLVIAIPPAHSAGPLSGKTICLDPGHGGTDPGAVNSPFNLRESDINLDVAYAVKALLEKDGADVVMTRTGNEARTERERAAICNRAGATITISVHTNSVASADPNGTLTVYAKAADVSLAQAIHSAMLPGLRKGSADPASFLDFGVRQRRFTVLRRTTMPAALVEPVFMSDPAEAQLLAPSIYSKPGSASPSAGCAALACRRGQIVQGIHQGVLRYFEANPG